MPITDHYHGEVLIFCYYKWRGQAENPFLQVIQSCAALCSSVGVEVIVGRVLIMLGCRYTVRRGTLGDCQHHNTTEKITNTTSPQKKVEETPMSQWTFLPIRRPYSTYPLIRTYFSRFSLNGFLCKWCLVEF